MPRHQGFRPLLYRWIFAMGVGLLLGACAAIEQASVQEAEKEVSERARQRWDLVAKGQIDAAYEFLSPASRSTVSLDLYRKRAGAARWTRAAKVEKVDCRADTCQVTMVVEYDLHEIKGLKRSVEETWVKDSGSWWLVAGK
jgi:hypothetical protein